MASSTSNLSARQATTTEADNDQLSLWQFLSTPRPASSHCPVRGILSRAGAWPALIIGLTAVGLLLSWQLPG